MRRSARRLSMAAFLVSAALCGASSARTLQVRPGREPQSRLTWTYPFTVDLSKAAAVAFDFRVGDLSEFSDFGLSFESGGGWYSLRFSPDCAKTRMCVNLGHARIEGTPAGWNALTRMRLTAWRCGNGSTEIEMGEVTPVPRLFDAAPGERRTAYSHYSWGLTRDAHGAANTVRELKACGFTDYCTAVAYADVAFYRSKALRTSPQVDEKGDALAALLRECRRGGVKYHAWIVSFLASPPSSRKDIADELKRATDEGLMAVSFDGKASGEWHCPTHPVNRSRFMDVVAEIAGLGVDGIHYDYIRYPNEGACFCAGCRERFEAFAGRRVDNWPKDVRSDAKLAQKWKSFRCDTITSLLKNAAARVRGIDGGIELTASVFPAAGNAAWHVAQDWPEWISAGCVDAVHPMSYTQSVEMFGGVLRKEAAAADVKRIVPTLGLRCWQDDGRGVERMRGQIAELRAAGCTGFGVFNFEQDLLPALRALAASAADAAN